MIVIRDMYCPHCGMVTEDVWLDSLDVQTVKLPCAACGQRTKHRRVCNGGSKLKCYLTDFTGCDFGGGQLRLTSLSARDSETDTPIAHVDGGLCQDRPRLHDVDRKAARADRQRFARRRRRGQQRITMDLAARR